MRLPIFIFLLFSTLNLSAQQVGINNSNPDPSSVLDIQSGNKGILIPRMLKSARLGIANPANGLMVYQTGPDSSGFYYFQNTWHYINYDSMLPPTAIVLSKTHPNNRLLNNNFGYAGQLNIPNATVTSFYPSVNNVWQPVDSTAGNYPLDGTVNFFSVWADSVFFLTGGFSNNNDGIPFYKFNPATNKWTMVASSPMIPAEATQARVGNKWIFWGGIYNPGGGAGSNALQAYIFDMNTYTVTNSAMPNDSARRNLSAATVGNNIYFWGGLTFSGSSYYHSTGKIYNTTNNTWSSMAAGNAPSGRMLAGMIAAGTNLVVWGGFASGFLNNGGIYRTSTNTWVTLNSTNAPVTGTIEPAMAYYNNFVYIISGNETKRLDPVANTWTTMAPPPYAFNGQKFSYDGNGKIYVWGGARYFLPGAPVNTGYVYDIASNTYTSLPTGNAPVARAGHTVCANNNGFFVWGGSAATVNFPTTIQSMRSGGLFYLNANNVYVTEPVGGLYMYEKQ